MWHQFFHRSLTFHLIFFLFCGIGIISIFSLLSLSSEAWGMQQNEASSSNSGSDKEAGESLLLESKKDAAEKKDIQKLVNVLKEILEAGEGIESIRKKYREQAIRKKHEDTNLESSVIEMGNESALVASDLCCCSNSSKSLSNISTGLIKGAKYVGIFAGGAIVVFSLGINLLLVSTEDGSCGTMITSRTALPKIWAILGGGAISLTAVYNVVKNIKQYCIKDRKFCKRQTDSDLSHKNKDIENVLSLKRKPFSERKVVQIVLIPARIILSLLDASRDAYVSGSALECLTGGGLALRVIGVALNGSVSFCIAYIGSSELLDLILAPCKGGSSKSLAIYKIRDEIFQFHTDQLEKELLTDQLKKELLFDEECYKERLRDIFDQYDVDDFFTALEVFKVVRRKANKEIEVTDDYDRSCWDYEEHHVAIDVVILVTVGTFALMNGISLGNIFSSETMLQDAEAAGLALNGSYVESGNVFCNTETRMPLIVLQVGMHFVSATTGWELAAYMVQGVNVAMVAYMVVNDGIYLVRLMTNRKDREMLFKQPTRYFVTRGGGLVLTGVFVAGYAWNLFSSLNSVNKRNALLGCIDSPILGGLSQIPAKFSVSFGVSSLTLCFMYGWRSVSSILDLGCQSNILKKVANPVQNWFSNMAAGGRCNCCRTAPNY